MVDRCCWFTGALMEISCRWLPVGGAIVSTVYFVFFAIMVRSREFAPTFVILDFRKTRTEDSNSIITLPNVVMASRVLLVTAFSSNYQVGHVCASVNQAFAVRHGYGFRKVVLDYEVMMDRIAPRQHPTWFKVQIVLKLLQECVRTKEYDYLIWLDADAMIVDQNRTVNSVLALGGYRDLIIGEDHHPGAALFNAGVFFVKVTDWSRIFWQEVWTSERYFDRIFYEQSSIEKVLNQQGEFSRKSVREHWFSYKTGNMSVKLFEHVAVLARDDFNSGEERSYTNGSSWIFHPTGRKAKKLERVLRMMKAKSLNSAEVDGDSARVGNFGAHQHLASSGSTSSLAGRLVGLGVGAGACLDNVLCRDVSFLRQLCHLLPKVELHQHLTGSMPNDGIVRVLNDIDPIKAKYVRVIPPMSPSELPMAWDMLVKYCDAVASAQRDPKHLAHLFASCIETLAKDNVMYCELRIGLKSMPTKRAFLAQLTKIIEKQKAKFPDTTIRLLLSVNRHGDLAQGAENIDIAIESFLSDNSSVVCGVELGGVATSGSFKDMRPLFQKARDAGLSISLHCGEDIGRQDEWKEMIEFGPDRLGHCVHCDDDNLARIVAARIPVETCLTCHRRHFGVPFEQNVFGKLYPTSQVVACTDNPSIYEVVLTDEYENLCHAYNLTVRDLFELGRRAIDFTFQSGEAMHGMRLKYDRNVKDIRAKFNIEAFDSKL